MRIESQSVSVSDDNMFCIPRTILLNIETVVAGKIFVAISAVFIFD